MQSATGRSREPLEFHEGIRGVVYGYLLRQIRDPDVAEDLTQETLFKGYRYLGRLRDRQALLGWLLRIARHSAVDWLRHQRASPVAPFDGSEIEPVDPGPVDPEQVVAAEQDRRREHRHLRGALAELSGRERALLIAHYFVGMSCREISERQGISVANVKVRLHRARRSLRQRWPEAARAG